MTQFWVLFISVPLLVWLSFLIFVICLVVLCKVSNKPAPSQDRPTLPCQEPSGACHKYPEYPEDPEAIKVKPKAIPNITESTPNHSASN